MLDRGSIFVYKVINKGLMKSSSGRSSVVEHQLPKLDTPVRFWSPAVGTNVDVISACSHSHTFGFLDLSCELYVAYLTGL